MFLAQRDAGTSDYLEALLADGKHNQKALEIARHARSRVLRQLEFSNRLENLKGPAKAEWDQRLSAYLDLVERNSQLAATEVPRDQRSQKDENLKALEAQIKQKLDDLLRLNPESREVPIILPPGEVTLAYHQLTRDWVGFAYSSQGLEVKRLDLPTKDLSDLPALATLLLGPFDRQIRQAKRIRVLPYGKLKLVDFTALPFHGDVLLRTKAIVYGLDLAARSGASITEPKALIVADTQGNLPGARTEAEVVSRGLKRWRWQVDTLSRSDATIEHVRNALTHVGLLHFAGHGESKGSEGWESRLLLAKGGELTPGDVLTFPAVPAWVVLAGCETGSDSQKTAAENVGIAQGFILAGSHAVIAAVRPVKDQEALALVRSLYQQEWSKSPDLADLLRRAQLQLLDSDPGTHWESFRVFEP